MKRLLLIATVLLSVSTFGQITLKPKDLDNGLRYPIVTVKDNPEVGDSINALVKSTVEDLFESAYCVGDYAYYIKGKHIELHLVCNCVEMAETDHRFLFINLESGKTVPYSDLFQENKHKTVLNMISGKIRQVKDSNACGADYGEMSSDISWDEISIRLNKEGFEIKPAGKDCATPIKFKWEEFTEHLKYNFL